MDDLQTNNLQDKPGNWLSQILFNWKNFKHIVILDFLDLTPNTLNSDKLKNPNQYKKKEKNTLKFSALTERA